MKCQNFERKGTQGEAPGVRDREEKRQECVMEKCGDCATPFSGTAAPVDGGSEEEEERTGGGLANFPPETNDPFDCKHWVTDPERPDSPKIVLQAISISLLVPFANEGGAAMGWERTKHLSNCDCMGEEEESEREGQKMR